MAREFSKPLYHSGAWRHNRANYLNACVDMGGHVLSVRYPDGSAEPEYYWTDEHGFEIAVSPDRVVPPGMCERCFAAGEYVPATMVHHITPLTPENVGDPHIALSYDNFMRLCDECHAAMHARSKRGRVSFDEFGNVVRR